MRRTRELVGEKEMAGRKYGFWKTLYLDCTPAYRDALTDAESRKKEAGRGLPEAQIKVHTYRCEVCGFLESYAPVESSS